MTLIMSAFLDIARKSENAGKQHFLLFSQCPRLKWGYLLLHETP